MTTAILSTPAPEVKSTLTPTVAQEREAEQRWHQQWSQFRQDIALILDAKMAVRRFSEGIKTGNDLRPEQYDLLDEVVSDVVNGIERICNDCQRSKPIALKRAGVGGVHLYRMRIGPRRGPDGKRINPSN
jgi:hypothetical protein